jgi:hypothetical protein
MRRSFSFSFFLLCLFVGGVLVAFWRGRSCVLEGVHDAVGQAPRRAVVIARADRLPIAWDDLRSHAYLVQCKSVDRSQGSSLVGCAR